MRIRLQLLLPLAVGLLVGLGFLVVAAAVDDSVRDALLTVPGLTRERAAQAALRQVLVTGSVVTIMAALITAVLARMIALPLKRVRETAQRLAEADGHEVPGTPVAEIQDVARGITRVAEELRARHAREVRERTELATLVDAVSEGILQLDDGGRVVRSNRAARELLGLPEDAGGRPATTVIRNAELRRLLRHVREREGAEPTEVVLDGRRVLLSITPQMEGGVVVTAVDLTDLRRLEEVRRDFVANASHELKTPLTSIRGYTETLLDGDLPPAAQRQFLATIARNADRLQRIVDDLLDLSRLESGGWQPEFEPIDLLEAAERFWLPFTDRAAEQGVAFAASAEGETVGVADARALEQVFGNLYDNALRYSQDRGRVEVRVKRSMIREPEGVGAGARRSLDQQRTPDWLVVEVQDTGAGIPRDSLPRIFERFYRVDPARSRAEGGTGLGLSIVKHMMESMHGAVTAESELGKGTTIRLWVPSAGRQAAVAQS